jgi:hypothetical protein
MLIKRRLLLIIMQLNETYNNYIIFNKLKNYIINNNNCDKFLYKKSDVKKKEIKTKNFKSHLVYPRQYDKLFWCFYILYYGIEEYNDIDNKHFLIENKIKLDFVETIRNNSSLLKEKKIKKIETELDISSSKKISINSFHALCLYNHINVVILCKNIYYQFMSNNESPIHVLDLSTNIIGCASNVDDSLMTELLQGKFFVENPNRPLRSMSFYKISDLHDYCKKLNININFSNGKAKKKQELYDEIKELLI